MKTKKLLSLLLALAMMFSLTITAGAVETNENDLTGAIVILHTNDVHGALSEYAKVAALKDTYEKMGAYVLLMDAGDFIQGDPVVSISQGATAVELMNMAGYDVVTTGNHEFDYGYANLAKLAGEAKFPVVAANVLYKGKTAFEDNVTFTSPNGVKIGVFGLATPETATKANPAKIKDVKFLGGQSMFDCAQAQVDSLKADGCDIIVCLGHLGIDAESAGNRSTDLLEEVEGIDIFIDGHSHSDLDAIKDATDGTAMVGDALLTSTGTKLNNVGVVVIADDGAETMQFATKDLIVTPDKTIADRAAAIQKEIDDDYGTVFAKTEVDLNGVKAQVRTGETNLGDLITDALVWGAKDAGIKVDAAITNGGGIRASIATGDITKKDINTVLPFGNTLSIVKLTGAELLEALEASTYCTPESIGGFPHVSGIVFTLDTTKAYDAGDLYPGSTYHAPKSINRVTIQSVGGKAFNPKTTYTIATNDFMAAGGDTYYAFNAAGFVDTGVPMDEVVMDYIKEVLKGKVTAEDYGTPAGRITIVKGLPFTDVPAGASYYDALKYVYENDIFKGYTETTFGPDNTLTRGQMVTVLWRMNGSPEPKADCPFGDVAAASPFRKAIAWAAENGLTNGYTPTTFVPGQAISRQQFLTILYRYAKFMGYDVSVGENTNILSYEDVAQVSEVFIPAMQWACGSGVLVADKTLTPAAPALRYQVAEFLANFCQKVVPAETSKAA
ncbi:5'-nucleotidase C-terminal domain-containing protein [Dysosmobacter sp.]|uniref:5'-nucleotidase C-terminal domain-containing protein n=1 Tax=Dysosmobacter sp. TaxID=2591382 RepID=UPI002A9B5CE2|nr:5'-nucleotidase C-terminal domain-containing protein [Dysosmobacter sp.]MDY5613582.1 5'-nucleotidase C-terminal domain-containing protein [Dysosmobacter sp.]